MRANREVMLQSRPFRRERLQNMDVTTGQKLSKARNAKGLSVDEVAHATKLRPDKILALEHDDYSRFPNNAYVKGFLQIYGRYLGVDVRAALSELENPSPVSISDYQYLNSAPAKEPERLTYRRKGGKPSLVPLVVFLVLCAAVAGGSYLYINAKRLGNLDQIPVAGGSTEASVASPTPVPARAPAPEVKPPPALAETPVPPPEAPTAPVLAPNEPVAADRDFIAQTAPRDAEVAPATVNEVVIEPIRKTWITVRRDSATSAPIFEDYLYTNAPPLKLRGSRFFIEVREEGAVVIRKNGAPIAYQGSGVTIQ